LTAALGKLWALTDTLKTAKNAGRVNDCQAKQSSDQIQKWTQFEIKIKMLPTFRGHGTS
jgi:hypothetical protein